jgi:hypothetical protein
LQQTRCHPFDKAHAPEFTIMKSRHIVLLGVMALSLTGCATRSATEHAACVYPCSQDMQRMEFLEAVRQSGFEATRMNVVDAQTAAALAAAAATEPSQSATAKAE